MLSLIFIRLLLSTLNNLIYLSLFNDCFSLVQLKFDDDLIKKEFANYLGIKILIKGILFINHYKIFNLLKKI